MLTEMSDGIIENKMVTEIPPPPLELNQDQYITYTHWEKDQNCINNKKLSNLREMLKFYKNSMVIPATYSSKMKKEAKNAIKTIHDFALIGTKKVFLERINKYFMQEINASKIQRIVRGRFVRIANSLRGPAIHDRSICVNSSDFYSLEPLVNINFQDFFSYNDINNFTYGFELESLLIYIKKRFRNIKNPYNRGNMDEVIPKIYKLKRLIQIINTHYIPPKRTVISSKKTTTPPVNNVAMNRSRSRRNTVLSTNDHIALYNYAQMIENVRILRLKTFSERVRLLFIEIDQLGNYTQQQWFSELDRRNYLKFYRILKDIWTYRAQIPQNVKSKICPLWDPFMIISSNSINMIELELEQLQTICITIIEDMIYTGIDVEYKTIGAFHVLSALTFVNLDARSSMPWLYESIV